MKVIYFKGSIIKSFYIFRNYQLRTIICLSGMAANRGFTSMPDKALSLDHWWGNDSMIMDSHHCEIKNECLQLPDIDFDISKNMILKFYFLKYLIYYLIINLLF